MTVQLDVDYRPAFESAGAQRSGLLPRITLNAPSLSYLRLSGFAVDWCRPSLSNLTTLHLAAGLYPTTYGEVKPILKCCPLLSTLVIYDDLIEDWPANNPADTFRMETLQSLQLFGNTGSGFRILYWLIAPNLTDVVLAPAITDDLEELGESISAGDISLFMSVKTLTLAVAQRGGTSRAVALAASCFPNVDHLVLPTIYWRQFKALLGDSVQGVMWPELRTLSLHKVCKSQGKFINTLVAYRKAQGYPLTTIRVSPSSAGTMPRLGWLKSEVNVEWHDDWLVREQGTLYEHDPGRYLRNPPVY